MRYPARQLFNFRFAQISESATSRYMREVFDPRKARKLKTLRSKATKRLKCYNINMPFFIYILECADESLYVGCTNNLAKRLNEHNESKYGAHYTKLRRPVKLVYYENYRTLAGARRRESVIKGWKRQKKLNLIQEGGQRA